ncbi:DUF4272 domain-containing protein [Massilia sp. H6]|uniref:DUF4272 domain-containing protein n=1 Tax=Massilia sp. H6 TaxID=2970464 RepID=UPI002167CF7E|nr:DUF4272 domain-containing protein [Massilia sp. H6]UVW29351.1 DUF4272 domain-containing protein [Massilia sp. H6]
MTAQARKAASEAVLQQHGIGVNPQLPMLDDDDGVSLRSEQEVWCRLVALWGVVSTAMLRQNTFFKEYFATPERRSMLSNDEAAFLFEDTPPEEDIIRFSWRLEALVFLAWCAGLVDDVGDSASLPAAPSNAEEILPLYPHDLLDATTLRAAIRLRGKAEILDRADLLYRLHWAVRDAKLTGSAPPAGINPGVVLEWHHAVNWMIRDGDEDDWDAVSTDT